MRGCVEATDRKGGLRRSRPLFRLRFIGFVRSLVIRMAQVFFEDGGLIWFGPVEVLVEEGEGADGVYLVGADEPFDGGSIGDAQPCGV